MAEKQSKTGFWIAIAVLILLLSGSVMVNLLGLAVLIGGASQSELEYPVDEEPQFEEIWSYGDGGAKVVRIDLSGVIMRGRQERLLGYEPDMVESILSQIRAAAHDETVEAILLEVDSPGGAVTPSDEIYEALNRFKASAPGRLVFVFVRDLGASGAYYAAMAGDYIMAEPTAVVGSVGVIMQTLNMKGLGDKIGLSSVTIASGENKDLLNPFEEIDPEHVAMLQNLVDRMQDRFASIVMESRGLESREFLDGRIFTADQAMQQNFIDGIGYFPDVFEKLKELLETEHIYLVRYQEKMGFFDALMASRGPSIPDFSTISPPRFMYLWRP